MLCELYIHSLFTVIVMLHCVQSGGVDNVSLSISKISQACKENDDEIDDEIAYFTMH